MKFSLICATINKTKELQRLLESLANQSYKDFELIVIDQNRDSRLRKVLSPYLGRFRIIHFNSSPGLSSSRNLGIREANGNIVAFPDDDCWYPADLLGRIVHMFRNKPEIDIFTGRSVDENGMPSGGRWGRSSGRLNRYNIWTRGLSITIFLRASVVRKIGMFDESLGLRAGTPWGSGEETDYLLRALKAGQNIYYEPRMIVFHPQDTGQTDRKRYSARALSYGRGMGRVLRMHKYPFWFAAYYLLRSFGGVLMGLLKGDITIVSYYWSTLKGRIEGWIKSGKAAMTRKLPAV